MTKVTTTDVKQKTRKVFIKDKSIQNSNSFIKNVINKEKHEHEDDDLMTEDNKLAYKQAVKEFKNNQTVSLNNLKVDKF